jgi:hypothetical protein
MTPNADDDIRLYASVLEEIKIRTSVAAEVAALPQSIPRYESIALQLRMNIELIVLGSLTTHRRDVEQVSTAFGNKGADEAAKLMKRINADYGPRPVTQEPADPPARHDLQEVQRGFLREEGWRREWGYLSSLLHAQNPYRQVLLAGRADIALVYARLEEINANTMALLNLHLVKPPSRGGGMLLAMMRADSDGRVHVYEFEKQGHGS